MTDRGEPAGRPASGADAETERLRAELEAERAGTAYWRDVAAQRRIDAARVQRRPLVRAAVAFDRRTRAAQDALAARGRRAAASGRHAALVTAGLADRRRAVARSRTLDAQLARLAEHEPDLVEPVVVVPAGPPPHHLPAGPVALAVLEGATTAETIAAAVAAHPGAAVCLVGPTTRTLHAGWLAHLVGALDPGAGVVAATALTLHPLRPLAAATPHDQLVRWAGLEVVVTPEGAPVLRSRRAGEEPDLALADEPVALAAGSAVVVARAAWDEAGGLRPGLPYDAAIVDLSLRLGGSGGTITSIAAAAVRDDRPVTARNDLDGPLAPQSEAWRSVVELHGSRLVAEGEAKPPGTLATIALTTATPSRKIAARSGDWHFASLLAQALERAGHVVHQQSIEEADSLVGRACDLHLVLRGLEPVRRTPGQGHVLWIISHPEAVDPEECDAADLVLVASERYAEHLRGCTTTPVEVLLQATDPQHFRPDAAGTRHHHGVTIVENTRGVMRPAVADAIAAGLDPTIYGLGWTGLVDPARIAGDYVEFATVPEVYASADVVLNDHWETMRRWGFVSNRIFDVLACGSAVVSDPMPEIDALFGSLVPTWTTPDELRAVVANLRADPEGTARRTAEGRALVLDRHTFDHRVAELHTLLDRHDVAGHPRSTP